MFRKLVELQIGPLSDEEFRQAMVAATADIKVNRINWRNRTHLKQAIKIAALSVGALRRCS